MKFEIKKNTASYFIASILILTAFFCSMQNAVTFLGGEPLTDASVFRYMGSIILRGGMPYRDSFDHKGPLVYLFDALGMKISYWKGMWLIGFLLLLISAIFLYKTAKLTAGKKASLLATVSSMLVYSAVYQQGGELVEEDALPFLAIAGFIFTDYFLNNQISFVRLVICGFCFGSVLFIRPNIVALWVVMCLAVLILCLREKDYKALLKYLIGFFAGLLLIVVPIILWLYRGNAFGDFIRDYWTFNSSYTADSSSVYGKIDTFARFLLNAVVLLCMCSLLFKWHLKKKTVDLVWLLTLFLNLIFISISGKYYLHYGITLVPSLIYPLASICDLGLERMERNSKAFFLAVWTGLFFPYFVQCGSRIRTRISNADLSEDTKTIVELVKQNTLPSDQVTVFGNNDVIYLASDRQSVSRYSYQSPIGSIDPTIMDSYFEDLETKLPKAVVVNMELSISDQDYQRMYSFLDDHSYQDAGEAGGLTVFVLRSE